MFSRHRLRHSVRGDCPLEIIADRYIGVALFVLLEPLTELLHREPAAVIRFHLTSPENGGYC